MNAGGVCQDTKCECPNFDVWNSGEGCPMGKVCCIKAFASKFLFDSLRRMFTESRSINVFLKDVHIIFILDYILRYLRHIQNCLLGANKGSIM